MDEITWQREYLLRIIAGVDTVIHRDWIQYYDEAEMAACGEKFRYVGIGIDLAISDKDTADYTAMVTAHVYGRIKNFESSSNRIRQMSGLGFRIPTSE